MVALPPAASMVSAAQSHHVSSPASLGVPALHPATCSCQVHRRRPTVQAQASKKWNGPGQPGPPFDPLGSMRPLTTPQNPSNQLMRQQRSVSIPSSAASSSAGGSSSADSSSTKQSSQQEQASTRFQDVSENFCIIENQVKDFENLPLDEIGNSIQFRRNRIFLLLEEVRRLRIQLRLKGGQAAESEVEGEEKFVSALPFLPPLSEKTLQTYYAIYVSFFAGVILFGALLAPTLEVKLGIGGTSYSDFVRGMHLPMQLAQVDPIVASFCGGAVGVVSCLLVIEKSNVTRQQRNKCHYCEGTGYLTCGNCIGAGIDPATRTSCSYCSNTGKVMCTGCLCTGKLLATEYDVRRDPFE